MTPVNIISDSVQESLMAAVIESLSITSDSSVDANIKEENLAAAADLHYYLANCPDAEWIEKLTYLTSLISSAPTRTLVATVNKMITRAEKTGGHTAEAAAFKDVLGEITEVAGLDHSKIEMMIRNGSLQESLDNADVRRLTNHPVHIVDAKGEFSPSSFIPFCEFGGEGTVMGLVSDRFEVPVCNKFQPVIFYDQVCYEVDVASLAAEMADSKMKRLAGLTFWLDYNEEKQTGRETETEQPASTAKGLSSNYFQAEDESKALIYIGTLGRWWN